MLLPFTRRAAGCGALSGPPELSTAEGASPRRLPCSSQPVPHQDPKLLLRRHRMDLGAPHRKPPGRACQAPQQQRCQDGHDGTEYTTDSHRPEPKVRKSKWLRQPEVPDLGRPGNNGRKSRQ
ncbi:hypothetical protein P7K49_021615 [Saguinus oedipus]|uniref:Uncharacterized protein n=1 Tax=Saguinus oedipus TaxID=9490 RepID=A0ABQ9UVJ4_SAGOE|nr:hypothetical protein P7K49_021615 [Saguinus oedipus]